MKIYLKVTDDTGNVFEGHTDLARSRKAAVSSQEVKSAVPSSTTVTDVNFSLNERAFMKKYAKGMSGTQKFTLLLARLVQGKVDQEISGERLISTWNQMKNVLGGKYNAAHPTRAKETGWVNSPKRAHYSLSKSWKEAFSGIK